MNWTDIEVQSAAIAAKNVAKQQANQEFLAIVAKLWEAANVFKARGNARNFDTARDMAAKLQRFGSFASDNQRAFAEKLIGWAFEEPRTSPNGGIELPTLYAFMQRTGELFLGEIKLSRKRADKLVWILLPSGCVGKIEDGVATLFQKRMSADQLALVEAILRRLEADPVEVLKAIGREYGRCGLCGQELSNPESIAMGIGPICAGRL